MRRYVLLASAALVLLASPATAQRIGVGLGIGVGGSGGGGGGTPSLSGLSGTATADAATGTVLATPASTLSGCTWSIASQGNFAQSSSTGVVTKAIANVTAGSYAPATTCSVTSASQTITVSAPLAFTIAPGATPLPLLMTSRANVMGFNAIVPSNGTDDSANSRIAFYNETGAAVTKLRTYDAGWYIVSGLNSEVDNPSAFTVTRTVESSAGAVLCSVTWSGATSKSVAPGTTPESDECTLSTAIAADDKFFVRTFVSVAAGGKWPRGYVIIGGAGEAGEAGAGLADKTASGTISGSVVSYGPVAIKATAFTGTPKTRAFAALGDSINQGISDTLDLTSRLNIGGVGRAFAARYPFVNMAITSSKATEQASYITKRVGLAKLAGVTDVVGNWGVNDLVVGQTASQITTALTTVASTIKGQGLRFWQATITPETTGNMQVPGGQTILASPAGAFTGGASSQRSILNANIRSNAIGADGYLEIADAVEPSRDAGVWSTSTNLTHASLFAPVSGTVQSGATTTSVPTGQTLSVANRLYFGTIAFTSGALAGTQARICGNTTAGVLTVTAGATSTCSSPVALASAPAAGDGFTFYARDSGITDDGIHPYRFSLSLSAEWGGIYVLRDAYRSAFTAKGW